MKKTMSNIKTVIDGAFATGQFGVDKKAKESGILKSGSKIYIARDMGLWGTVIRRFCGQVLASDDKRKTAYWKIRFSNNRIGVISDQDERFDKGIFIVK